MFFCSEYVNLFLTATNRKNSICAYYKVNIFSVRKRLFSLKAKVADTVLQLPEGQDFYH